MRNVVLWAVLAVVSLSAACTAALVEHQAVALIEIPAGRGCQFRRLDAGNKGRNCVVRHHLNRSASSFSSLTLAYLLR